MCARVFEQLVDAAEAQYTSASGRARQQDDAVRELQDALELRDRVLLEADVGHVHDQRRAIEQAEHAGFLGANALGPGRPFRIKVKEGAGAFVCGEETALIAS